MATYYTFRCPHCGMITEKRTNQPTVKGSPLKKCKYCHKDYIDKSYIEVALKPYVPPTNWDSIKGAMAASLFISGGFSLFFCLFAKIENYLLVWGIAFVVLSILFSILFIKNQNGEEVDKREYQASEERLNQLWYAETLKDLGYDVPEKYLKPNSNDLEQE